MLRTAALWQAKIRSYGQVATQYGSPASKYIELLIKR